MNSQQNNTPIDNELLKLYSQYKLCRIEKCNDFSEPEKAAIITILKDCQFVDGNTVRSIMNEAFEHSSADSCLPVGKKADAANDSPSNSTKNSTKSMANVIDLTLDGEDSTNSSPEPTYLELAHRVSSSSAGSSDDISDFGLDDLISNSGSFKRKRKYVSLKERKGKGRAEDVDMQDILSGEAFIRLGSMLRHAEENKRTLFDRMKTVNDSFDIQNAFPIDTASYGNTEMFKINKHFDRRSRLNQSQEHLAAYKIGKLTQQDRKLFSSNIVDRNMKRYYQDLIKKLKFYSRSHKQDSVYFSRYCERVVSLVEKTGLYAIFIPEILPPYRIKITSPENFEKIENYLSQRCSCFKSIAHFDENGKLKMEDGIEDSITKRCFDWSLEKCQFVNGDHLHAILPNAFENSVQKPLFEKVDTNAHTANVDMNNACNVTRFNSPAHSQPKNDIPVIDENGSLSIADIEDAGEDSKQKMGRNVEEVVDKDADEDAYRGADKDMDGDIGQDVDKTVDKDMDEVVSKNADETMSDDAKQDVN